MAAGNGQRGYSVSIPPDVLARLRTLAAAAAAAGLLAEYLADLGRVNDRLMYAPKQFGDPQYTYTHAKIRVYRAWTEFLDVSYGVHTEQPVVFVRDIRPRDDRPLAPASGE